VLLDGWGGLPVAEILDVGCDVDRAYSGYREHAVGLQPSAECANGPDVGPAGVRVADLGGEEFQEAVGGAVPGAADEAGALDGVSVTRWFI